MSPANRMSRKSSGHLGHWKNPARLKLNPDEAFGFVYLIVNLLTGRRYIGKKQYHRYSKGRRRGTSDWKTYTSSSREVNGDIARLGKKNFHFEILAEFKTRGGLTYGETNLQHVADVLTLADADGNRIFYNAFIDKIRFIPTEFLPDTSRQRITDRVRNFS